MDTASSSHESAALIEALGLQILPVEGIWFRETWRNPAPAPNGAPAGTAIYGLITDDPDSFSSLHVLEADELWHFYSGDPLELLLLHPDGLHTVAVLGPDVLAGQHPQVLVPAGVWMGADLVPGGRWCLFGTTMAPGFTPAMFRGGNAAHLSERWPTAAAHIGRLCRPDAPTHMVPTES